MESVRNDKNSWMITISPECHDDNEPRQRRRHNRRPGKRSSCWSSDMRSCRLPSPNSSFPVCQTAFAAAPGGVGAGLPIVTILVWPAGRRPVGARKLDRWWRAVQVALVLAKIPVAVVPAPSEVAGTAACTSAAAMTGRQNADGHRRRRTAVTASRTPGRRSWTCCKWSLSKRRRPTTAASPMPANPLVTTVCMTASSVCSATIDCNCSNLRRRRRRRRCSRRRCRRRRHCRRIALVLARYLRTVWPWMMEVYRLWKIKNNRTTQY